MTTPTGSARWTEELHKLFVELCAAEVIKGNRVGTTLNKEGWAAVHKELVRQGNVTYTIKQFKNHWDENARIGKFKNKDLSLFMHYYDMLFGDIVATGERAKTANTYSAVHLETGEEFTEIIGEDDGKEGSGDSDDNMQSPSNLFPSTSLKSGRSSGSKRKKSGAEYVREGLDGLVAAMSSRSTSTTAANEDASLNAAVDLLDSMDEVVCGSDLYYFARRYILEKGNRTLFLKARNNTIRFGELMYNFKLAGNHFPGQ